MGKVGGGRNFGYGKMLAYAGKNALKDRYGAGHYASVAAHEARWKQFVGYLKDKGIKDAREINQEAIIQYAHYLEKQVKTNALKVSYAQNLLSTINVVLSSMRKDSLLTVSPSALVGKRSNVREAIPATINPIHLNQALRYLEEKGEQRVALLASLCRELGLRFKEASLLNTRTALREANKQGSVNITRGTKGGRGKGVDRWVPVSNEALTTLATAEALQGTNKNLIPEQSNFKQWRDHAYSQWRLATKDTELRGFHELRAAYACERYAQITGSSAPVISGSRTVARELDHKARVVIALELGHSRTDVLVAYLGSAK